MENTIKYSILIPVYNTEKYVERCLESIFAQDTKSNYEIIVCDDGSTDHSYEIISKYKNVKLLQNQVNQRGVVTRNRLIRENFNGHNYKKLAKEFKISEMQVRNIINNLY